jgi:hypothetical protein
LKAKQEVEVRVEGKIRRKRRQGVEDKKIKRRETKSRR